MSPKEFFLALNDHREREQQTLEYQTRASWEIMRAQLFHLYNMNPYIKKRPKKVEDVFKLSWDISEKKVEPQVQTPAQMKSQLKLIAAAFGGKRKTKRLTLPQDAEK